MKTVAKCLTIVALLATISSSAFAQMSGSMDSKKPGDTTMSGKMSGMKMSSDKKMSGTKMMDKKMSKKMMMKKKMMMSKKMSDKKMMDKKMSTMKPMSKPSM
jgi:hypothetical protein